MARTAKNPTPTDAGDVAELGEVFDGADVDAQLERVFSELGVDGEGSTATILVHKISNERDNAGKEVRVYSGPPDTYDLHTIALNHGSGDYRVRIYTKSERGNNALRVNRLQSIALTPDEERALDARRSPATAPTVAAPAFDAKAVADMIDDRFERMLATMRPPAPVADPFGMFERFVTLQQKLSPQRPAQPEQTTGPAQFMEALKLGIELGKTGDVGEPSKPSPWEKVFEKLAPLALHALTPQGPQSAPTGQTSSAPYLPAPTATPGEDDGYTVADGMITTGTLPDQAPAVAEADEIAELKKLLAVLVKAAGRGGDYQTYANFALDQLPDDAVAMIDAQPTADLVKFLGSFDPRIAEPSVTQWFTGFVECVKETLKDEAPPADPPGTVTT